MNPELQAVVSRVARVRAGEPIDEVYPATKGRPGPSELIVDDLRLLAYNLLDGWNTTSKDTNLYGIDGTLVATVKRPEDARLFSAAAPLRDALEHVRADFVKQCGPDAVRCPSIQKADVVLQMAGPQRNPGISK